MHVLLYSISIWAVIWKTVSVNAKIKSGKTVSIVRYQMIIRISQFHFQLKRDMTIYLFGM